MSDQLINLAHSIEEKALHIGFSVCGFAKAEPISEETTAVLDHWTGSGYHAGMGYMERNRHLRLDPAQLVPGCRTLIVVALNYYPARLQPKEDYQMAYDAYGKDNVIYLKRSSENSKHETVYPSNLVFYIAKDEAEAAVDAVGDKAADVAGEALDKAQEAVEAVEEKADKALEEKVEAVEEEPYGDYMGE